MKAIVFDFNGTLFNDTDFHIIAWQKFLRDRFQQNLDSDQVRRQFIGSNNRTLLRGYLGDGYSDAELERMGLEKEAYYRETVREHPDRMRLMEGAPELFDDLIAHGIPFALATASTMDNIQFYLEELGLRKWFTLDRIVYDNGKLASKPDPAFYIEAMRRIGAAPEDCIIVEDSPSGFEAAERAGAGRIIAIDRTAPREWLEANEKIHAIIHDFVGFEKFL